MVQKLRDIRHNYIGYQPHEKTIPRLKIITIIKIITKIIVKIIIKHKIRLETKWSKLLIVAIVNLIYNRLIFLFSNLYLSK